VSEKYEYSEAACLQLVSVSLITLVLVVAAFYTPVYIDPSMLVIALGLAAIAAAILAVSFEMKRK
jgi:hypothetical protein